MSWPIASFALLAGALAVGWLAYERSRPSARSAALVGTLAALAALGREAFAAVPEVKPITAMTFVVGYALGPLPGFVVGAMGMLVSNVMLGQGPYTPWQMAAWGGVGLIGALAGTLSRRRLRRVPLALGCAFAATIAMAIMDLYEWTVNAAHTPAAFVLIAVKALPFDVVDVGSTLIFGLAFGPELARLLARMRARTTVCWERAGAAAPLVLAAMLAAVTLAAPPAARAQGAPPSASAPVADGGGSPARRTIAHAVAYLRSAQADDGGFGAAKGSPSSPMFTAWTAIGLAAAGRSPLRVERDGHSAIDALRSEAAGVREAGAVERTMLALHAAGLPAGRLAGRDLTAQLLKARRGDGSFEGRVNITAFAVLALRAAGRPAREAAVRGAERWLSAQQNGDGSFSFAVRGDPGDVDDTAAAMEAIAAGGRSGGGATLRRAAAFLRRAQNGGGGFPLDPGGTSNAQSTAWAVQGLIAAHARLPRRGRSPIAYLESLAAPNGSIRYAKGSTQTPVWVTAEALAALARRPLPIGPPRLAPHSRVGTGAGRALSVGVAAEADAIAAQCLQGVAALLG